VVAAHIAGVGHETRRGGAVGVTVEVQLDAGPVGFVETYATLPAFV
jgi:hypothetical protein